ncbi:hypothetical protein J6590_080504 [Homalodisca vitripennis]|nr:hypothetical protein J6590_080504 [Homalodisca vitripennis]
MRLRTEGLPRKLPTKLPTDHGGPRPEPFRMKSFLVRVSYVPSMTKVLVSEARGQPGIRLHVYDMSGDCIPCVQHQLHNGVWRNVANCGDERSPGLGEALASEGGVMNIIILLWAVSTAWCPDFSHPVEVFLKLTIPRQELTQVPWPRYIQFYLPSSGHHFYLSHLIV